MLAVFVLVLVALIFESDLDGVVAIFGCFLDLAARVELLVALPPISTTVVLYVLNERLGRLVAVLELCK